jgi:hypothetical protein
MGADHFEKRQGIQKINEIYIKQDVENIVL